MSSYTISNGYKENSKFIINAAVKITEKLVPHFEIVTSLLSEILEICEKAKSNKKICRVLADRTDLASTSIGLLRRHMEDNLDKFREKSYFRSFIHFESVLENIKKFVQEVSELDGLKKYFISSKVHEQFEKIRDDFDHSYNALQLGLTIDLVVNREKEDKDIKMDLNQLKEYHEDMRRDSNFTAMQLSIFAAKIENLDRTNSILGNSKPPQIDTGLLLDPVSPIHRDSIVLKKYRCLDVACKPINNSVDGDEPESKKLRATLAIWNELSECPYIIKFLGISNLDIGNVMVLEWAQFGNLRSLYEECEKESKKITWEYKLSFARDIFRSLSFLNSIGVLHHDVRCENILVTEGFKCKITNFSLSRKTADETSELNDITEVMRWMAPEKLRYYRKQKDKKERYTNACEMFSFGMLLWELAFDRIPYKDLEYNELIDHVLSGKREHLNFEKGPRDIIKGFTDIITSAWKHDYRDRLTNQNVSNIIEPLYKTYFVEGNIPMVYYDQDTDKSVSYLDDMLENEGEDVDLNLLPLKDGVEYHYSVAKATNKLKDYKICWECFKAHADMDNKMAIYWKGFYLWEGYVKKDQVEAKKLYKIAADAGIAIAQFNYAFAFDKKNLNNPKLPFDEKVFWKYLYTAAENNHATALYHVGDCYYNGKIIPKDVKKGIEYFKLAAYQGNTKAIKDLQKFKIPF